MPRIECPSCGEEVLAGKYCIKCGAVLIAERTARLSPDVLEEIAEKVAAKLEARLAARKEKESETAKTETPPEAPRERGLFRK